MRTSVSGVQRRASKVQWMRKLLLITASGYAAIGLLMLNGCHVHPPSQQTIDEAFPIQIQTAKTSDVSQNLDIYVDDSLSMAGFVKEEGTNSSLPKKHASSDLAEKQTSAEPSISTYKKILKQMFDLAPSTHMKTTVYPISSDRSINSTPEREIESPGFYSGKDTPLATVLNKVADRTPHTAILVSDMVLSDPKVDNEELLNALTQLAGKEFEMRLLAFRSDFHGTYFSEAAHGTNYTLNRSAGVPDGGHPFYLLVIAPNTISMDTVQKYILSLLDPAETFDPSQPAFEISKLRTSRGSSGDAQWSLQSQFKTLSREARRFESGYTLKLPKRIVENTVDLDLTATVSMNVPLRMKPPAEMELKGKVASWDGKQNLKEATDIDVKTLGMPAANLGPHGKDSSTDASIVDAVDGETPVADPSSIRMVMTLRKPAAGTWDIYHLRILPGRGQLDLPHWVYVWSSDDDSTAQSGNHTYRLNTFVRALENAITERQPCGDWVLKINGGDK